MSSPVNLIDIAKVRETALRQVGLERPNGYNLQIRTADLRDALWYVTGTYQQEFSGNLADFTIVIDAVSGSVRSVKIN
jgi:hypothetical protein